MENEKPSKNKKKLVGIITAVVVVTIVGVGLALGLRGDDSNTATTANSSQNSSKQACNGDVKVWGVGRNLVGEDIEPGTYKLHHIGDNDPTTAYSLSVMIFNDQQSYDASEYGMGDQQIFLGGEQGDAIVTVREGNLVEFNGNGVEATICN